MMDYDKELVLIVPNGGMKREVYPKEFHNRIIVASDFIEDKHHIRKPRKVILDEGFLYKKDIMAKLYYKLGKDNISEVYVYGS